MLEEKIDQLIAKMDDMIAALRTDAPATTATATPAKADKPANGGVKPPKITFEQVKAAVVRVKDAAGKPAAQRIIKEAGKAAELAAIKAPNFEAVLAACEALLAEDAEVPSDEEDAL